MDSVVAAQGEPFGEIACSACELGVNGDPRESAVDRLELGQRALVRGWGEASRAPGRAQSGTALGVGKDARCGGVRTRPQFIGDA
jgi:hypothetical protein